MKLGAKERIYLERLARESGRSRGQVLQRLIIFAVNSPDALRALGAWDYTNNQPKSLPGIRTY